MKKFLILSSLFIFVPLFLFAYASPGNPTGFVNDFAGIFSEVEKSTLEQTLITFEKESSNEISVVTIASLEGDTIENYAEKLFQEWGIGKEKNDNGVLLLVAFDDQEMRIEVGYGLEGALPDALTSSIIRNTLVPAFQKEEYYIGITSAVVDMMSATRGEYEPLDIQSDYGDIPLETVVFIFLSALSGLVGILAELKGWWAGGVIGGAIGVIIGLLFASFLVGISLSIVFAILGLIFDYVVSNSHIKRSQGTRAPWWRGGGGGGGFGGGFGGFGGGRSGGGGSSGRW